jgi:hypothetical protein
VVRSEFGHDPYMLTPGHEVSVAGEPLMWVFLSAPIHRVDKIQTQIASYQFYISGVPFIVHHITPA